MGSKRRKRLEQTVAAVQSRFGWTALRRGGRALPATVEVPRISTSFPALDRAIGGGIPRGRITEIIATPTAGMTTLALKVMAQATTEGDTATFIDLNQTFDPDYAARCEIDLSKLLIARPPSGRDALKIVVDLVASRSTGVLVVHALDGLLADPSSQPLVSATLRRLPSLLAKSPCAAIFLSPLCPDNAISTDTSALAHQATLRLRLEKEQWLHQHGDIRGYRAQVTVLKNKLGRDGGQATIAIKFNGTVRGDGT